MLFTHNHKIFSAAAFWVLMTGFNHLSVADDTEIYGASTTNPNRVHANVLFIMDTSGSMAGEVSSTPAPYDPAQRYTGSYYQNDIYNSLSDDPVSGHKPSSLTQPSSTNCAEKIVALNTVGKVLGNFKQYRSGRWRSLRDGNDGAIRCDTGNSNWLYSGNYMNWKNHSGNVTKETRMQVVVDVVKRLTYSLSDINLGLMRFDQGSHGGMIDVPVSPIDTSGALIRNQLDGYYPKGGTPLEETMYEAATYYRGENWIFGKSASPNPSVSNSRTGAQYSSPISASCQKNHIILLTDGEPTSDQSANARVQEKISALTLPSGLSKSCYGHGDCLDELSYWMKNTDHSDHQTGNQDITTHTIGGFNLTDGVELLKRTASWGGGRYYAADDTEGLTEALESIFLNILSTESTFVAPSVSVNSFNATEHRDELYYALFRPSENIKWTGNLKKYRLTDDGFVVGAKSNTPAISETTGYFNDGAFDYWNDTSTPDGQNAGLGGMANLLDPSKRNIYSEDGANYLNNFNYYATQSTFNMTNETYADFVKVRDWTMGFDVEDSNADGSVTDSRHSIGDPLHSEPVIITYGGSKDNPDATMFFGTNEGFIHAIDTSSGHEEFAFIPQALHGTQKDYFDNTKAAGEKPYGMDGKITTWFYDKNNNNVILNSSGYPENSEHVYLYAGMRRGGKNYYALDVTNRAAPKMLFKIEGGKGDFAKLGQTWSGMTVAKVKFNGESRFVLFFAGGYDTNQDSNSLYEEDTMGNAIYMVDATTGKRLWWTSNTSADLNIGNMVNSMPASVAAVDITGDGHINYLFASDTGGRVFRIDFNPNNSGASDFAKGGAIAALTGLTESTNRRFYNKPNVALVKDKQYGDYLTIAIGSGHRAHPIQTLDVENRFYVIKDFYPYGAPKHYAPKVAANENKTTLANGENANPFQLYNATKLMLKGDKALTSDMQTLMANGGGWYVTFSNQGEKVLAESTTFAGAIIFTTFSPSSNTSSSVCGADTGTSRIYTLNQKSAMAAIDLDGDGDTDNDDASKVLAHSGIAPRPVVIYRKGGSKSIVVGTETIEDDRFEEQASSADCEANGTCGQQVKKCETNNCYVTPVYWRQNEK